MHRLTETQNCDMQARFLYGSKIWCNMKFTNKHVYWRLQVWGFSYDFINAVALGRRLLTGSSCLHNTVERLRGGGCKSRLPCRPWRPKFCLVISNTGMRRITTFRPTTDSIYDGGPLRLWYNITILYYNIIYFYNNITILYYNIIYFYNNIRILYYNIIYFYNNITI